MAVKFGPGSECPICHKEDEKKSIVTVCCGKPIHADCVGALIQSFMLNPQKATAVCPYCRADEWLTKAPTIEIYNGLPTPHKSFEIVFDVYDTIYKVKQKIATKCNLDVSKMRIVHDWRGECHDLNQLKLYEVRPGHCMLGVYPVSEALP